MIAQELSTLHRSYVELSDRFRSAWAFHQFVGSLHKILLGGEQPQYPADFQQIYGELKEISHQLNATGVSAVRERLDRLSRQLGLLITALVAEDSRIDPSAFRQFFVRAKQTDLKILVQLVKFYVYSYDGEGWPRTRLDKIDFLVTRIAAEAEAEGGGGVGADRESGQQLLKGLWGLLGNAEPAITVVATRSDEIAIVRSDALAARDLEDFNRRQIVTRFREIKHSLGVLFFYPEILTAIVELNLRLRDRIQQLYQNEEQRLFSEYHRIFELERAAQADRGLQDELGDLRHEIERFERHLSREELSLEDLARIRERIQSLLPRLEKQAAREEEASEIFGPESVESAAPPQIEPPPRFAAQYERVVAALEGVDEEMTPEAVVLKPEVFAYRLETREVVAFRRLAQGSGDLDLERALLEAAALRVRMNEDVAEIQSILDDTAVSGEAPIFAEARRSAALGDRYGRRLEHYMNEAITSGNSEEARDLQILRMRLQRVHSGLWLLVYKPIQRASR